MAYKAGPLMRTVVPSLWVGAAFLGVALGWMLERLNRVSVVSEFSGDELDNRR